MSDNPVIQENGISSTTFETYKHSLQIFERWLVNSGGRLTELTRVDIQTFLNSQTAHGRSPSTIRKYLSAIRYFAAQTGQIEVVNKIRIRTEAPQPTAPKSLERRDELAMLRKLERKGNIRDLAIWWLLIQCGLRVSELCGLNLDDIQICDYKNGLRGEVRVIGKRNKLRYVPIPHQASEALQQWLKVRRQVTNEPAIFLSTHRKRMTRRQVERILAGVGTHPHALRHTYCTRLAQEGNLDLVTIAELAGHSDINTTRRYTKPTRERLHEAIEQSFNRG
jgi:integrase/recombinase XerD